MGGEDGCGATGEEVKQFLIDLNEPVEFRLARWQVAIVATFVLSGFFNGVLFWLRLANLISPKP